MDIQQILTSHQDIRSEIFIYLSDLAKNNILSCNHTLYEIKKIIRFIEPIMLNDKICKLSYYDSFTNVFDYGLYMDTLPTYPDDYTTSSTAHSRSTFIHHETILDWDNIYNSDRKIFNHNPSRFYRDLSRRASKKRTENIERNTGCKQKIILPKNITHLQFDNYFNKKIKNIPVGATRSGVPGGATRSGVPSTIKYLKFGYHYNKPLLDESIPESTIYLDTGSKFNQPIEGFLPNKIKCIKFGCEFNQLILPGTLPVSLEYLHFISQFNKPLVMNSIPPNIKVLIFGYCFNQKINKNVLPDGLEHLDFNDMFDQPISVGVIPESVKYLRFGHYFNQQIIPGVIPPNVQRLIVESNNSKFFDHIDNIPKSVTSLTVHFECLLPEYIEQNNNIKILTLHVPEIIF